jgi:hypothetical protein
MQASGPLKQPGVYNSYIHPCFSEYKFLLSMHFEADNERSAGVQQVNIMELFKMYMPVHFCMDHGSIICMRSAPFCTCIGAVT